MFLLVNSYIRRVTSFSHPTSQVQLAAHAIWIKQMKWVDLDICHWVWLINESLYIQNKMEAHMHRELFNSLHACQCLVSFHKNLDFTDYELVYIIRPAGKVELGIKTRKNILRRELTATGIRLPKINVAALPVCWPNAWSNCSMMFANNVPLDACPVQDLWYILYLNHKF